MTVPLWSLEVDHSAPATCLTDDGLLQETLRGGLSPSVVRKAFADRLQSSPVVLELIQSDGKTFIESDVPVGDMLIFNWFPVFSMAAYRLLLEEGCKPDEFINVRFRALGEQEFKAHLPLASYDAIDLHSSIATQTIPLDPPIPFHFVHVKLKPDGQKLPPCFRVPAPGHPQVLAELFALDTLRRKWLEASLQGATFRRLAYSST